MLTAPHLLVVADMVRLILVMVQEVEDSNTIRVVMVVVEL